ncbi:DMT family transporter [Lutibaculum baratangense]|uniref:EamA domain-containing protein n=1 Tax=Lutibaculum baratangense AMV1 TaxID=631454 RepID=V4RK13_9HYPH|nr:DMT family transporter [Lutibaculum baratangense]ESR25674.1 hypothetical protein N177_1507 [Lutibaculum baratangense AMV1]
MNSILFGTAAALSWGLHDLLIRFIGRGLGSVTALMSVLAIGAVGLGAAVLLLGIPLSIEPGRLWLPALSGLAYAVACLGLYRAIAIGPFALVAPIIASYPVLSVAWAIAAGTKPAILDLVATAAIVGGVAIVARYGRSEDTAADGPRPGTTGQAIVAALCSSAGFAVAFAAGQAATDSQHEIAVTAIARVVAVLAVLPLFAAQPRHERYPTGGRRYLPLIALIATLDVAAIAFVVTAGSLPSPEMAAVVASGFGVVTILLARLFLKEPINLVQGVGIAMVFGSVMMLAARY